MVLTALAGQLMTPERLPVLLSEARKHQRATSSVNIERRAALRKRIKDLEQQIDRLLWRAARGHCNRHRILPRPTFRSGTRAPGSRSPSLSDRFRHSRVPADAFETTGASTRR